MRTESDNPVWKNMRGHEPKKVEDSSFLGGVGWEINGVVVAARLRLNDEYVEGHVKAHKSLNMRKEGRDKFPKDADLRMWDLRIKEANEEVIFTDTCMREKLRRHENDY